MKTRQSLALISVLNLCGSVACQRQAPPSPPAMPAEIASEETPSAPQVFSKIAKIENSSSLYTTLKANGFAGSMIHRLVQDSKPVINLAKLTSGTQLIIEYADAAMTTPNQLLIKLSATKVAWLKKDPVNANWQAEIEDKTVTVSPVPFKGLISSNLWDSAEDAGMPGAVVTKLAEVFAWQIDFNRELRVGDEWRLTVERLSVDGEPIGWGNIIAAEYINASDSYVGIRFPATGKALGYFSLDGSNLKKLFLKSPIAFGRVTSGFSSRRMHPILGINQPHNGVDYGAPVGTPVFAVGSGTVDEKTFRNTTGNHLRIRHNSIYETGYSHLSRFAPGIRVGSKVEQGQVIAYVGATGLATGPHLHFSFFEHRRYVDPQGLKFPSADPVPPESMQEFLSTSGRVIAALPDRFTSREKVELANLRYGEGGRDGAAVSN